jgi:hypothetical protein
MSKLARQIGTGACQVLAAVPAVAGPEECAAAREILGQAAATDLDYAGRDQLIAQAIAGYRAGSKELWGAVLLELMASALMTRLIRYATVRPTINSDDIAQQLVLEVLRAAAVMPVPADGRYLGRRLLLRAATAVTRWLRREHLRQAVQEPELADGCDPDEEGLSDDCD